MERVAVFVDGSNFFFACRENLGRTDIDLGKFAAWLVGPDRQHVRTYYYNCPLPPDADTAQQARQQKFYGALARIRYFELRLGKLAKKQVHCSACGKTAERYVEKGVDMRIGVDKHVELATLPRGRSWELVQAADVVHELDESKMRPFFIRA